MLLELVRGWAAPEGGEDCIELADHIYGYGVYGARGRPHKQRAPLRIFIIFSILHNMTGILKLLSIN